MREMLKENERKDKDAHEIHDKVASLGVRVNFPRPRAHEHSGDGDVTGVSEVWPKEFE